MHVVEAVPHVQPKIAKNDVVSQKTQKTQISEALATVSYTHLTLPTILRV